MKLSPEVHRELECFFRLYFSDEHLCLPAVKIYIRRGAWLFSKLFAINGITLGNTVFIKPSLIRRSATNRYLIPKNLLAHELTHVVQYQRRGFLGFLTKYFRDFFTNLFRQTAWNSHSRMEAYLAIPDEIEARHAANAFIEWLEAKR